MRKVNGYPLIKCGNLLTSLKTGPFGSALNTEHWTTNGTAVLTIGSLGEQSIIEDELLYISDSYAEKLNPYRVNEGDIVFSRVADIGRAQLIDKKQDGWVISSNLMKMTITIWTRTVTSDNISRNPVCSCKQCQFKLTRSLFCIY